VNPFRALIARIVRAHFGRLGRNTTTAELADVLEANGRTLSQRFAAQADGPKLRETLRHVIGIERWGQRRLRVALGEPFEPGGHRPYRPSDDADLDRLRVAFATTRADSVALARKLAAPDVDPELRIRHDDLNELGVNAWLAYLDGHANIEARRRLR
jgi:hypothetical protein